MITMAMILLAPLEVHAQDPSARLQVVRKHLSNQRLDKAMKEIVKVLAADPGSVEAWKLKAEIFKRQADLDGALEASVEAARFAPDDAELLLSIGDLLTRRNDRLNEALDYYTRSLALDPNSVAIMVRLGSLHERREEWQLATERYRAALILDPNDVRARSGLGAVLFKIGEYGEASRELRKAIELSPRDLRSKVFLGMSQNHLGNYDVALDQFKEALLIDPHSANQLIGVREQSAQFHRLTALFLEAYERSPREAGRSYDLAVIYFYAHDYEEAWRFLTRAEQLRYPIPIEFKEVLYSKRRLRAP